MQRYRSGNNTHRESPNNNRRVKRHETQLFYPYYMRTDTYAQELRDRLSLGYNAWPIPRAARLLAIKDTFGSRGFDRSIQFKIDEAYIKELYHLDEQRKDTNFVTEYNLWCSRYNAVVSEAAIDFINARDFILRTYNFIIRI